MARTPLRQLRLVSSADVYKAGVLAGTLHRLRDRTEFSYLPGYLDSGHRAVACLSGDGDLHAKNLAILHDERGEWRVTPAYDLPSSAVYGDRTMALPIGGKIRQQLSWTMLRILAETIGILARLAAQIIREQVTAAGTWIGDLAGLPHDANRVRNLRRLIIARMKHIEPPAGQHAK